MLFTVRLPLSGSFVGCVNSAAFFWDEMNALHQHSLVCGCRILSVYTELLEKLFGSFCHELNYSPHPLTSFGHAVKHMCSLHDLFLTFSSYVYTYACVG